MVKFIGVKITNLHTDEQVVRGSLEDCNDEHEQSMFNTVKSMLVCISMGCCVAEPVFEN